MSDENALKIPTKPPIGLKRGIGAARATFENTMKNIDPKTVPNRIGIVLDDSGSMGHDGMENAHKAVKGFTNSCNMTDTSIAIYPLNKEAKPLISDYDILNAYVSGIGATGGTPLYTKLDQMIKEEEITRAVVFSDGVPTDSTCLVEEKETNDDFYYGRKDSKMALEVIMTYNNEVVPIDTIFIGEAETAGYRELKKLAEMAKGTFIHFKDSNSLSTGLKYLAPKYRALLANPEIKAKIERGENV
jgi:Mg-chelatase subunit ChlD